MSVVAKAIINAAYAGTSTATVYTVPASSNTIIDKFTATNVTGAAATLNVYIIPSGGAAGTSNMILNAVTIPANSVSDLTQMQNQVLNASDLIAVAASAGTAIVIRGSGREIS